MYLNIKIKANQEYNFDFSEKGWHLIVGDNGCGKSTLLNTVRSFNSFKDKVEIDTNCAEALIKHGGFATKNLSNGQRHLSTLARWIEENKKEWDEKTLLVFDEADRGFGLKYQAGMVRMFDNFFKKYKARSLAVSHYSLPILLTDKVYWFETPKLIGEKDE